jgi:Na+-translocating ferredoxin:NAD+ oxidoreductase RnfE subunit
MLGKEISSTDEFLKGLWRENPVFIMALGLCPALAVLHLHHRDIRNSR